MYAPLAERSSRKGLLLGLFALAACGVLAVFYFSAPQTTNLRRDYSSPSQEAWDRFGQWMKQHNKSYESPEEMKMKWQVFHDNYFWIKSENQKGHDFTLAVNQFADLTTEEFKSLHLRPLNLKQNKDKVNIKLLGLPESIDWLSKGAVNAVKNQGSCGSCWAFSSTGALEGAYQLKTGKLVSFSEQQLVDCSKDQGNEGCNGGFMDQSWEYYEKFAAESESDYGYEGKDGTCRYDESKGVTKVSSYVDIAENEAALKTAVGTVGPVSIGVDAVWWQFYFGGVYSGLCGTSLDHGVLAVGYGVTDAGKKYWKIKNSWGSGWGENGYIRVVRTDKDDDVGKCGVAKAASYPVL